MKNGQLPPDPCLAPKAFSGQRFLAFTLLFVVAIGTWIFLVFTTLGSTPYGVQLLSVISYTAFVIIYGFARNKSGICPYLFTCPTVVAQYPRLLVRHAAFLAALIAVETPLLIARPYLPVWWTAPSGKDPAPYVIVLAVSFGVIALVEIFSNRALLERAHRDRLDDYPDSDDDSKKDDSLSILGRN